MLSPALALDLPLLWPFLTSLIWVVFSEITGLIELSLFWLRAFATWILSYSRLRLLMFKLSNFLWRIIVYLLTFTPFSLEGERLSLGGDACSTCCFSRLWSVVLCCFSACSTIVLIILLFSRVIALILSINNRGRVLMINSWWNKRYLFHYAWLRALFYLQLFVGSSIFHCQSDEI